MTGNKSSTKPDEEQFTIQLACALHSCGVTAHHLEDSMAQVGQALGIQVDCFAAPTALLVSVEGERTRLFRVEPTPFDLGRLVAIDTVTRSVAEGSLCAADGATELARIGRALPHTSLGTTLGAFALVSSSTVAFFDGNGWDLLVGGFLGAGVGWLLLEGERRPSLGRLADGTAALLAAALAVLLAAFLPISVPRVTLSALIVLVPGLTLTLALAELSERHLVSGSARLAGGAITFLQLGVGSAMGWSLGELLAGPLHDALGPTARLWASSPDAWPLGAATDGVALLVAPLAISVLFNARVRDYPVIFLSCWLGYLGTRLGGTLLGPQLGAFLGAFSVGVLGKAQAAVRRLPASVSVVPGILLLVPGSMGFGSFSALLAGETVAGVDAAFSMFLVASSLVAGLLVAHAVPPTPNILRGTA